MMSFLPAHRCPPARGLVPHGSPHGFYIVEAPCEYDVCRRQMISVPTIPLTISGKVVELVVE